MVPKESRVSGVCLELPAKFVVSAPHNMSQFKVKTVSLFVLFGFLRWHFL